MGDGETRSENCVSLDLLVPVTIRCFFSSLFFPHSEMFLSFQELIEIDHIERLINLKGLRIVHKLESCSSDSTTPACQRLSRIGDEIVEQLVEWTKMLPFYHELPVEVHTHLLTQRWAELVRYCS